MKEMIMTEQDREIARLVKNEIMELCLVRKVSILVALAASRSASECFEDMIGERGGEVFEASVCKCEPDRGTRCFLCLSAGRVRIMAREFERRKDMGNAARLFDVAAKMEGTV